MEEGQADHERGGGVRPIVCAEPRQVIRKEIKEIIKMIKWILDRYVMQVIRREIKQVTRRVISFYGH